MLAHTIFFYFFSVITVGSALMVIVNDPHTSVKRKLFDCSAPGVSVLGMNIGEAASRRCIENYK